MRDWIWSTAEFIKGIDYNHMVILTFYPSQSSQMSHLILPYCFIERTASSVPCMGAELSQQPSSCRCLLVRRATGLMDPPAALIASGLTAAGRARTSAAIQTALILTSPLSM